MIGNKVLTVCEYGNSRSVGCAFMLKEKYGKDAIACGIRRANPDTFDMLCEWADSIVVTVGHLRPEINPKYNDKVLLWDVGHDRYFIPPVPELLEQYENYYSQLTPIEKKTELIPRKVYTAWLSADGSMPELIKKCIDSQKRMCDEFGYEHHLITLEEVEWEFPFNTYIQDALNSKHPDGIKYCKATDYIRFYYLLKYGGIFLDSDIECLPNRSFDVMLNDKMFIGLEMADWASGKVVLGTAVLGSEAGHPFLKWILNEMETKFSGSDSKNYESSMELLNIGGVNFQDQFVLYHPDYFHPKDSRTGEINVTNRTVCIHYFTKLWTPEVNQPSTLLQQFKYNIENNINFTFVKRGDGELACMRGDAGGNCDGHPYSKKLGERLWEAYEYFKGRPNTTIVEFDDQVNYNALLHRTDSNLKEVSEFYKAIAASKRSKYFIGPEKLMPVSEMLGARHFVIPEINWFSKYEDIMVRMPLQPEAIYIFCAGMPAKVLMHDIMKYEYSSPPATYIDCGSAFDCAVSPTRTFQITKEQFWELYAEKKWDSFEDVKARENFEKSLPVNNFNLPQETHPERLWVINNIEK